MKRNGLRHSGTYGDIIILCWDIWGHIMTLWWQSRLNTVLQGQSFTQEVSSIKQSLHSECKCSQAHHSKESWHHSTMSKCWCCCTQFVHYLLRHVKRQKKHSTEVSTEVQKYTTEGRYYLWLARLGTTLGSVNTSLWHPNPWRSAEWQSPWQAPLDLALT